MDWQEVAALVVVVAAAGALLRGMFTPRRRLRARCGGRCGCAAEAPESHAALQVPPQKNTLTGT